MSTMVDRADLRPEAHVELFLSHGAAAFAALTLCALIAFPSAARAQAGPEPEPERSRFSGSIGVLNTQPLGSLAIDPGWGVGMAAEWALDSDRRLRLRGEVRASWYGFESREVCLSETVGCFIEVDIDTRYSTLYVGAGPAFALPLPGEAELLLNGTVGYGSFMVHSSLDGSSDFDEETVLTTTNFEDGFLAWSGGGELRIPFTAQAAVSLGVHYQHNGEASYVPEGGITRNQDGSLSVDAMTSEANMMAITLGVAIRPFFGWTERLDDEEDDPDEQ